MRLVSVEMYALYAVTKSLIVLVSASVSLVIEMVCVLFALAFVRSIETPVSAINMLKVSNHEPRRMAETIPAGIPTIRAIRMAPSVSSIVAGKRRIISWVTGS